MSPRADRFFFLFPSTPPSLPPSRAASAARLVPVLASLTARSASITATAATAPPARWPAAALAAVDATARAHGARCVCWDDGCGGEGEAPSAPLLAWIAWDWGANGPVEGGKDSAALTWSSLTAALGPPLLPEAELTADKVANWLDAHTVRVHGVGAGGPARPREA